MIYKPELSIIIPIYNAQSYIIRLIHNLENLSSDIFEVIFVDDGSADESIRLIKETIKNNFSYRVVSQINQGQSVARNKGLEISNLDYVCFIDPDDYITEEFLNMFEIIRKLKKVDFIIGKFKNIKEFSEVNHTTRESRKKVSAYQLSKDILITKFTKKDIKIHNSAIIYRRDFLLDNNIRFLDSLRYGEDSIFMLNSIIMSTNVYMYNSVVYYYVNRKNSVMKETSLNRVYQFITSLTSFLNQNRSLFVTISTKHIECNYKLSTLNAIAKHRDYKSFDNFSKLLKSNCDISNAFGLRFKSMYISICLSDRVTYWLLKIL
jgi:glycosyltransferase involved in cell wall biosynthesis